jgi:DNA-binding beta-propeller fold protein YncE
MNSSALGCRALSVIFAAATLAGCGGSQLPIGAPGAMAQGRAIATNAHRSGSWMLPEAKSPGYKTTGPLLYATNEFNSENWDGVTVYRAGAKDPAPLATISDGLNLPFGACIDGQGTLYVTNEPPGADWVSEYPLGKTAPSRIITDGISEPAYCAIDAKGNLWVANFLGPNVTEYLKGSKKPHFVITAGLVSPVGIAIDRAGDLYVGNFTPSSERSVENVVVYAPGSKSPSRTITNGITSPRGLAVDSNGTLYVANVFQNNVAEFRSGRGDPFLHITDRMDHPEAVAVDKKGTLYVSNVGNSTVVEFAPGSLTPLKRQISKDLYEPNGIAHYAALLP